MGQENKVAYLMYISEDTFIFDVKGQDVSIELTYHPDHEEQIEQFKNYPAKYAHYFIEALNRQGFDVDTTHVNMY